MNDHNFHIIIGAQRCGTTYLYHLLDEHPEICMAKPLKPEPKFFLSDKYFKGQSYYYDKYFSHRQDHQNVFIEKSTSYYEYEIVPQRISETFINAKIILILRNPVERAISNYYFSKNNGLETRTIEDVFINNAVEPKYPSGISTNPFNYLKRGEYINYIEMYLKYISEDRLKIIFFNDIISNLDKINDLYEFLGVESSFCPNSFKRQVNKSENKEYIPEEVIEKLIEYYKPFNLKLELFLKKTVF